MIYPKVVVAAAAALSAATAPNVAHAYETMTVPGIVQSSAISTCSLLVNHDTAMVTPVVSLTPASLTSPTIVRFSFRNATGETVATHDVRVPAAPATGSSPALHAFPFPAVAAGTSVHCDVTPVAAETIVED